MKREKEKLKARQIIGFGWAWTWVCAQQCGCVCSAGACAQGHLSGEPGLALPGTSLVQVTGGLSLPVLPFSEPRESKKRVYWQNMISALGSHSYQPWGTLTWLLSCSGIIKRRFLVLSYHIMLLSIIRLAAINYFWWDWAWACSLRRGRPGIIYNSRQSTTEPRIAHRYLNLCDKKQPWHAVLMLIL